MRPLLWLAALSLLCAASCRAPSQPAGRTVKDGLGREVSLPAAPRRIVALAPSVSESILALGLGERLVGVSNFCELPEGGRPVARVGGLLNPDLETIRSLHPDLLIGTTSGNDPDLASQAGALGIPLYIQHTPDIDSVLAGLEGLADALGEGPRGRKAADALRDRLTEVQRRVQGRPRPRVLFIIWGDPLVVPGAGAFLTDAITRAGGSSVTADAPSAHPTFSIESAIARDPEIIVMTRDNADLAGRLRVDPAWAGVPAVRNGRVATIEDRAVRPGPAVVAGIEEMARLFHPEASWDEEKPFNN